MSTRNQKRRARTWMEMREMERAKYLKTEGVAIRIVVLGLDELPEDEKPTIEGWDPLPECMK